MERMKRSRPSIEPWGTPWETGAAVIVRNVVVSVREVL